MKTTKPKLKPLIPPDRKRCQADIPNGYSFMTLGGIPGFVRCSSKPKYIVKEVKPGEDGRRGSMSLCGKCLAVLIDQKGPAYCTVKEL